MNNACFPPRFYIQKCYRDCSSVAAGAESQTVATLDEANRMIGQLRDCNQSQHRLLIAWKQKLREQVFIYFSLGNELRKWY